jgi:hypothetical protein
MMKTMMEVRKTPTLPPTRLLPRTTTPSLTPSRSQRQLVGAIAAGQDLRPLGTPRQKATTSDYR